jgi:hypothetical protein
MNYLRLTCLILIVFCAITAQGQSGRRKIPPPPAAPVPTPTPEPTPAAKSEKKEPELLFFVGADRNTTNFYSFPLAYYDAVMRGCVERLRASSSASVDITDRDFSRGEAIKKAKAESKTYVVLLSLTYDSMRNTRDDIDLSFVVFEPSTAKVVANGRSYQNSNRTGPVIVSPPGRTSELYREQLLRQAGEDAAVRILKALHLSVGR